MDEFMKLAFEIVKAQAATKPMSVQEIFAMAKAIADGMKALSEGCEVAGAQVESTSSPVMDAKKSIKENSITCLECGKVMRILSGKHLSSHGLDKKSYCEKFGFKKGTSLACKGLAKARRETMKGMELWKRRGKGKAEGAEAKAAAPAKKTAAKKPAAPAAAKKD